MYHSVHPIYNSNWRSPSRIVGNKRSSISCLSIVHVMMISAVCWTNMIALTSAFIQYPRIAASLARATTATSPPVHDPVHEERSLVLGKCTRIGLDQDSTPLVDALAEAASNVRSPLFYPGHKMGRCSACPCQVHFDARESGSRSDTLQCHYLPSVILKQLRSNVHRVTEFRRGVAALHVFHRWDCAQRDTCHFFFLSGFRTGLNPSTAKVGNLLDWH